jgi:hypothetical protein
MARRELTNVVFVALSAMWIALTLACSWIPTYPIPGTPAVITFSSILYSGLTSPLLGLFWGSFSGFIFGWLVPYANPNTAIFGPLTFLSPTMAALTSGLFLFNRWKEATLVFAVQLAIWFSHPFAWYKAMPIVTWQYWLALALIVIPPVRKWVVNSIVERKPKNLTIALWCLAWIAYIGGDTATGNNLSVWIFGYGTPDWYYVWVPYTAYYAVAGALTCIGAAVIGSGALLALKKANMRIIALDQTKPGTQGLRTHLQMAKDADES